MDPKTKVLGDFDRISRCGRMTKNGKKLETVKTFNSVKKFCYKGEERHGAVAGGEQLRWKTTAEYFFFPL